jgi:hypothetical protein
MMCVGCVVFWVLGVCAYVQSSVSKKKYVISRARRAARGGGGGVGVLLLLVFCGFFSARRARTHTGMAKTRRGRVAVVVQMEKKRARRDARKNTGWWYIFKERDRFSGARRRG